MLWKGPDLNYALEVAFVILLAMNHRSDSRVAVAVSPAPVSQSVSTRHRRQRPHSCRALIAGYQRIRSAFCVISSSYPPTYHIISISPAFHISKLIRRLNSRWPAVLSTAGIQPLLIGRRKWREVFHVPDVGGS